MHSNSHLDIRWMNGVLGMLPICRIYSMDWASLMKILVSGIRGGWLLWRRWVFFCIRTCYYLHHICNSCQGWRYIVLRLVRYVHFQKMRISIFFLFIIPHIYQMFWYAYSFNSDISKWDTSSVINMEYMFGRAQRFNGDLSSWDVSNVRTMQTMFYYAMRFNSDIGQWDVSNVENMYGMVSCCWGDRESGRMRVWEFAHTSSALLYFLSSHQKISHSNPPYLLTQTTVYWSRKVQPRFIIVEYWISNFVWCNVRRCNCIQQQYFKKWLLSQIPNA